MKELNDPRARNLIDLEHGEWVIERELTFRHQIVHSHQNRDLDQAGGWKRFVAASVDARARLQVYHAVSYDAVMRISDRIELLPKGSRIRPHNLEPPRSARPRAAAQAMTRRKIAERDNYAACAAPRTRSSRGEPVSIVRAGISSTSKLRSRC
jgi:hypothetical protein